MSKGKIKYIILTVISIVLFVLCAMFTNANRINENTDIIILAQYIVEGMTIWYVMLIGFIAEAVIVKLFLKESYLKSAVIALFMNAVTTTLGFVVTYIVGFIAELLFIFFTIGSFHVSVWIVNFILLILTNACLDGWMLKLAFKYKFKKNFSWLCLANAISFVICILLNLNWIGEMFFTI